MKLWLWLVMMVFPLSSVLSITSLLVGYKLETRIVIRYFRAGSNDNI
jgi:hypothetical protein